MKLVIANRDIDDPAETKEISPVTLDLEYSAEIPEPKSPDFSDMIAKAVADAADASVEKQRKQKLRDAQAEAEQGFKKIADKIKEDTGVSIGFDKPWDYKPKPKGAYQLWKRVLPLFIDNPKVLDMGPTALAAFLGDKDPNYTVKRDMFYDKLNTYALSDLKRMLAKRGMDLQLKGKVTIRSVQKKLIERRDLAASAPIDEFSGRFQIRGDTAYVNGTPYKIQLGASGKRRIQYGRSWLQLDVLKEICLATSR